jgi:hypothetical protein
VSGPVLVRADSAHGTRPERDRMAVHHTEAGSFPCATPRGGAPIGRALSDIFCSDIFSQRRAKPSARSPVCAMSLSRSILLAQRPNERHTDSFDAHSPPCCCTLCCRNLALPSPAHSLGCSRNAGNVEKQRDLAISMCRRMVSCFCAGKRHGRTARYHTNGGRTSSSRRFPSDDATAPPIPAGL